MKQCPALLLPCAYILLILSSRAGHAGHWQGVLAMSMQIDTVGIQHLHTRLYAGVIHIEICNTIACTWNGFARRLVEEKAHRRSSASTAGSTSGSSSDEELELESVSESEAAPLLLLRLLLRSERLTGVGNLLLLPSCTYSAWYPNEVQCTPHRQEESRHACLGQPD